MIEEIEKPNVMEKRKMEQTWAKGYAAGRGAQQGELKWLRDEIERLRAVLREVVTNGEWTDGEQVGDWKISPEVYASAKEASEP